MDQDFRVSTVGKFHLCFIMSEASAMITYTVRGWYVLELAGQLCLLVVWSPSMWPLQHGGLGIIRLLCSKSKYSRIQAVEAANILDPGSIQSPSKSGEKGRGPYSLMAGVWWSPFVAIFSLQQDANCYDILKFISCSHNSSA